MTTTGYARPGAPARFANTLIRGLADAGISIAGTHSLVVRGRKTGKPRSVVVNLLTVDGVDYLVAPRGNTEWVRNVRAAGRVQLGPFWHRRTAHATEVSDDDKPALLRQYLQRWYWQVKGHMAGLTPGAGADELRTAAPAIPVFSLR